MLKLRHPRKPLLHAGRLWVASYGDHGIHCFDARTLRRVGVLRRCEIRRPRGLAACGARLYVACYGDPMGALVCVDLRTLRVLFCVPLPRPRGVAVHRGEVYVTEVMRHRVSVLDLHGVPRRHLACAQMRLPRGVAVDALGRVVVASSGNGKVLFLRASDGVLLHAVGGLRRPNDVACCGARVYASEWGGRRVRELTTGACIRAPGFGHLTMLCALPDRLCVSDDTHHRVHVLPRER